MTAITEIDFYRQFYRYYATKCVEMKQRYQRPMTFAEKVLLSHLTCLPFNFPKRGEETLIFQPDRVAMQDATAQMAVLQFMTTGLDSVKVPTTIHCDHLIKAEQGAKNDLLQAMHENKEIYDFLRSSAARYGMGFWQAGAGIIHQVVFEQFAFPAGMLVGTDSHTPNAGGMGMIAVGVGGADAVDVMAGLPWGLLYPKLIGVRLTGSLRGWASAKDVILKVAGLLKVKGGTAKVVEYFGSGLESLSATGRATIANMGAELGATASIFPYDSHTRDYLIKTARTEVAALADSVQSELQADAEVQAAPEMYFDQLLEINLDELQPQWVGPHTPDLLHNTSEMKKVIEEEGYPAQVSAALIGSCTNSSYEDISRASAVAKQAVELGLKFQCPFYLSPGSDQVYETVKNAGLLEPFEQLGAIVLCNACGPCIGQWKRLGIEGKNSIITSYNRNFRKRNDGNEETLNFIGSPELVTLTALAGNLDFNPNVDLINGIKIEPPKVAALPEGDFKINRQGYTAVELDEKKRHGVEVILKVESERLARLEPFSAWNDSDFTDLRLLVKVKGKCTTDHISQAGQWLKYRGHLPNISRNMLLGAVNAFTSETGTTKNLFTGEIKFIPEVASDYKQRGIGWFIVADENYGEGSSREHAAMEPRFLGCRFVIAKSFARIHETNLKKQGLLPLFFVNPDDYDLILADDVFYLTGLEQLSEDSSLYLCSKSCRIPLQHSLTMMQIAWFRAGSALNSVKK